MNVDFVATKGDRWLQDRLARPQLWGNHGPESQSLWLGRLTPKGLHIQAEERPSTGVTGHVGQQAPSTCHLSLRWQVTPGTKSQGLTAPIPQILKLAFWARTLFQNRVLHLWNTLFSRDGLIWLCFRGEDPAAQINTCVCVRERESMCACVRAYMCMCERVCAWACVCAWVCAPVWELACMCVWACA